MPFNIEIFKAQLNEGNLAKQSHFEVMVDGPIDIGTSKAADEYNMRFRCEQVEIPGRRIQTAEHTYYGPIWKAGYMAQPTSEVTLYFIASEDMKEKLYFEAWQDLIVGKHRILQPNESNQSMFDLGFYNDYVGNVIITQYDDTGRPRVQTELLEAYPIGMVLLSMSWNQNDFVRFVVQMHTKYYRDKIINLAGTETTPTQVPTPRNRPTPIPRIRPTPTPRNRPAR